MDFTCPTEWLPTFQVHRPVSARLYDTDVCPYESNAQAERKKKKIENPIITFRLYWELSKLFTQQFDGNLLPQYSATSQLIWRDYFYIMSFDNKNFDQIEKNPACLQISWNSIEIEKYKNMLECWKYGKTGYPFIDAGMRQLLQVYE